MEQQEAVVMPGNHAVDRAAVQFGSMGLGEGSDPDVDEDREEAETRTQPPQHSPITQPKTSLPPAPRQASQDAPQQESAPTPKQAPGLPPVPQHQPSLQQSPSNPIGSQAMQNQGSQSNQPYNQFARYGQPGIHSEASAPPQKPYDPFGQQIPASNHSQSQNYDYPGQSQAPSQPGAFSSAPDNYPSNYLTSEQRSQYQNYYGSYGQPIAQSQQEAGSAQQRTGSAFGSGPTDSAYSQSQIPQVSEPVALSILMHDRYAKRIRMSHLNELLETGKANDTDGVGTVAHAEFCILLLSLANNILSLRAVTVTLRTAVTTPLTRLLWQVRDMALKASTRSTATVRATHTTTHTMAAPTTLTT